MYLGKGILSIFTNSVDISVLLNLKLSGVIFFLQKIVGIVGS